MRSTGVLIAVVLTLSLTAGTSWSQDNSGPPISGRAIEFEERSVPDGKTGSPSSLREQFLELSRKRAELMSEATLKAEIDATQRNIDELCALQKLNEAKKILQNLTTEFPKSEAAGKAARMLDAIESVGTQAVYPDDPGPALNTALEESFRRSSMTRELTPQFDPGPGIRTASPRPRTFTPPINEEPHAGQPDSKVGRPIGIDR